MLDIFIVATFSPCHVFAQRFFACLCQILFLLVTSINDNGVVEVGALEYIERS